MRQIQMTLFVCFLFAGCRDARKETNRSESLRSDKWKPAPVWRRSDRPADRLHSKVEGARVILYPSKKAFSIPDSWRGHVVSFGNRLEEISGGTGEWDTEFSSILNAAFPFDRCCVHAGENDWKSGAGYNDIHLRVYDLDQSLQETKRDLTIKGCNEIARMVSKKITPRVTKSQTWDRVVLSFDLFFGDYGATANVDCFLRAIDERTFAFCFLYCEESRFERTINEIVESFANESLQ